MIPLADLIAHHELRERHCAAERDRTAGITDEKDQRRSFFIWETERRVARDTVAWLKTLQRRSAVAAAQPAAEERGT